MRIRTHAFALGALLVAALPFAGCDDSSDPSDGTICFQPRIEKSDACGLRFSMLVAPACAAADGFYSASLQVRHDFDNDGTWDTGYLPLEEVPIFDPITLPVDVWVVRSEVLYAGGSTEIIESSLDLPDWAPTPPDIIAAFGGYTDQPIDTVRVGVPWT
ncbi:MAG TPA: hypothetical protein PLQ13_11185, partial [Candidatus Krumholzibacteria bacterium]|nr:hypothetical protein [Candidatus Krumholzibacteria bacterium]